LRSHSWPVLIPAAVVRQSREPQQRSKFRRRIMPALPTGTVTFLFTAIEGSTARWERDRDAMLAAVERHLAVLRTKIESHSGVLFKVVGDAVQAAFPTAPGAIAAAVTAQRAPKLGTSTMGPTSARAEGADAAMGVSLPGQPRLGGASPQPTAVRRAASRPAGRTASTRREPRCWDGRSD
jgi:Adenylate and Guanylate cyclase catalytic domain